VFAWELEVTRKEKRLAKKEVHLDQREEVISKLQAKLNALNKILEEQRADQTTTVESLQRLQRELDGEARDTALAEEKLKAKGESLDRREADLAGRAADLTRQEKDLAFKKEMLESREKSLVEHELEAEEKERTLEERVRQFEVAQAAQAAPGPQAVEAMKKTLEDLQVEQRAGVQRIAAWAGVASTTLVPLGVSPIPVSELLTSISDALPVLDSTADRLRRLDQILGARLKAEGSRLCRVVIEYILTCFRSHDPAISLEPVISGPVADTEDAAREGIQDTVEVVAERFQRDPVDD
jgi:flagellar biosynthesis GTPase FlhF